jgi:hypothetical protein
MHSLFLTSITNNGYLQCSYALSTLPGLQRYVATQPNMSIPSLETHIHPLDYTTDRLAMQ